MKKICALLLVMCMVLSQCPLALMESTAEKKTDHLQMDVQLLLGESLVDTLSTFVSDKAALNAMQSVIENLHVSTQTEEDLVYTKVLLKDRTLLDVLMQQTDEAAYMTTSLLPGTAFKVPSPKGKDADVQKLTEELKQDLIHWAGEGEKGVYPMEAITETPYDTHYVLDLQDEELAGILEKYLQDLISGQETAFTAVSTSVTAAEDEVDCHLYTREDGAFLLTARQVLDETATDVLLAGEEQEYVLAMVPEQSPLTSVADNVAAATEQGMKEGIFLTASGGEESFHLAGVMVFEDGEVDVQYSQEKLLDDLYGTLAAEVYAGDVYVGLAGEFRAGDTADGTFSVRFPENQTLLTVKLQGKAPVKPVPAMTYDQVVDVENITAEQEEMLTAQLGMNAVSVFIQASAAMPDEMAEILRFFMALQMEDSSVGVIGGADGPTALFVATEEVNLEEAEQEEPASQVTTSQRVSIDGSNAAAPQSESTASPAAEATPTPRPLFNIE